MGASYPAGVTSILGETLSLSTALASLGMPGIETKQAIIYSPSVDFRLHINPAITAIYFFDNNKTGTAKWINLKTSGRDLTDRTTTGSAGVLDSITTSDRLLICFSDIVAGFYVDMTASVNSQTSRVMQCTYPVVATWTSLTETDGTKGGSTNSLGEDASVTFTAPTDWTANRFGLANHTYGRDLAIDDIDTGITIGTDPSTTGTNIVMSGDPSTAIVAGDYIIVDTEVMYVNSSSGTGDDVVNVNRGAFGSTVAAHTAGATVYIYRFDCPDAMTGFWLKINWTGGTLHTDVEIQDLWALNKNTSRGYFRAGQEYFLSFDRRAVGSIEAILAAGTDTLEVNWLRTVV